MSGSYVSCEFVQRCWLEVVEKSPICLIDESGIALYIADFDFHLRTSPYDEKQMRKAALGVGWSLYDQRYRVYGVAAQQYP